MPHSRRFFLGSLLSVGLAACTQDVAAPSRVAADGRALASGGVAPTGADLQISGSIPFGSPNIGSLFAYSFQVKNSGPESATGTSLVDVLPDGMAFGGASVSSLDIACSASGQTVTCDLGTIPNGAQATVTFLAFSPMVAGTYVNTATVTALVSDPKPTNNTVNVSTKVLAPNVKVVPIQAIAYSSLPADFVNGGYTIAGLSQAIAFPFVATATGTWNGVTVAVHGSGQPGRAGFWLYEDDPNNPGHPGKVISSEAIGPIPAVNDSTYTSIVAPALGAPVLTAGKQYWISALGVAGEGTAQWDLSANEFLVPTGVAQGLPGGPIFLSGGHGLGVMPAFAIGVVQ